METSKIMAACRALETKKRRFTVVENGNAGAWSSGQSSDTKSLVLLTAVLVVLVLLGSAGALTKMLSDGSGSDAIVGVVAPAQDSQTAVPYFPSQYVNQAKEIEEQPPTF